MTQQTEPIRCLPDHSIADLIRLALEQAARVEADHETEIPFEEDASFALTNQRDPAQVWAALQPLRHSENVKERVLFVFIAGRLGCFERPFRDETVAVLLEMLQTETDPELLGRIGGAFGQLDDPRGIVPMARLKNHPDWHVRDGVRCAMYGHVDDLAITTLIELSTDPHDWVRDWATLGLMVVDADTPALRDALLARLADHDAEIRGQALIGLAERGDRRVLEPLRRELSGPFEGYWAVEAAEKLGDSSLHSVLRDLHERLVRDFSEGHELWLDVKDALSSLPAALRACEPIRSENTP